MATERLTTIGHKLSRAVPPPAAWAPPSIPALMARIDAALRDRRTTG